MIHSLRYCCAMCFALISFLLATPQRAQAQTREAYVSRSANGTTLTFYYDDQRATRTGKSWGIEEKKDGGYVTFPAWAGTWYVDNSTTTRVVFDASFRDFRPTTTARWFYSCLALKQIEGLEYLNTQNVTIMDWMFSGCSGLTSLDVSHFDTQNVTNMSYMFSGCSGLTSLDVSHFNTQNVTEMFGMFRGCSGLTSLDVSHFNTQKVYNMSQMFSGCSGLTSLDVKNFDTQSVIAMREMFKGCSGLTSLDVLHFNTQPDTNISEMFSGCSALTTIYCNTDWDCPESNDMFAGCVQLKGAVAYDGNKTGAKMANPKTGYFTRGVEAYVAQSADKTTLTFYYDDQRATRAGKSWGIKETKKERGYTFPAWAGTFQVDDNTTTRVVFDASFRDFRPTTTARWFNEYRALKQIEGLEFLNTSEVKDMSEMFWGCSGLTSLDVSHFNTQNVTNMASMFNDCSRLTSLDLSHFNTQNVTGMSVMFSGCSGLTSLDVSHFNTQNVTHMTAMFDGCSGLTSLDVSHFNTQNVTHMTAMFDGCSGLTSLDLSHFNTQNVTDMWSMFDGCSGLTSLDVSHFNTENVTDMRLMFKGCSALTTIYCNTAWQCWESEDMFAGCTQLKGAVAYVDEYRIDARMANPETGYFTAKPTAVESVRFGADGAQQIYTLQGKCVRGAWKHLPAGVYVVNGKKTVKP